MFAETNSGYSFSDKVLTLTISGTDGVANAGEEITVECSSTGGYPEPTLTIERDGSVIYTGSSPQSHNLTVQAEDDGATYLCNATNSAGTDSTTLTLDISCKIFKRPEQFSWEGLKSNNVLSCNQHFMSNIYRTKSKPEGGSILL